MIKVGLTGNFWSGHNEVADLFEERDIKVFDADLVLKFILLYSQEHITKIQSKFGKEIYQSGLLDLKYFDDNRKFNQLFDIVQLDLIKAYEKWRIKNWNSVYTIFKSSVLFERDLDKHMNFTISVYRPSSLRKWDLTQNSQINKHIIDFIIDNEMDEVVKNTKSTYQVNNYSSMEISYSERTDNLKKQVEKIHVALLKKNQNNFHEYNRTESYKNMLM